MANFCDFNLKITGKKSDVEELIAMMRHEGQFKDDGLGRIFDLDVMEFAKTNTADLYEATCWGDCAWSIQSAMRADGVRVRSLESESERLNLVVEGYSSEPGERFQEHVLIVKGDVVIDDCVDYEEHDVGNYASLEAYNKNNNTEFTKEMINEDGLVCIGGFGDDYCDFEDATKYFVPQFPEQFVFEDLNTDDTEVYRLAAITENGEGFYLGDAHGFIRANNVPWEFAEKNTNGLCVFHEFAENGLYFEFDADDGTLSREVIEMLSAKSTKIIDSEILNVMHSHLPPETNKSVGLDSVIHAAADAAREPFKDLLPERCYGLLPSSGDIIVIARGETGYYQTSFDHGTREESRELVDMYNEKLGVTKAQAAAMFAGSMNGWNVPLANPSVYDEQGKIIPEKVRGNTKRDNVEI